MKRMEEAAMRCSDHVATCDAGTLGGTGIANSPTDYCSAKPAACIL